MSIIINNNIMVIHNYIFDSYRIEQEEIQKAIQLLKENGYAVYKKEVVEN